MQHKRPPRVKRTVASRREATILKQPQQVVVLSVDVATDFDGRVQLQQRRLREEDLPRLQTQLLDLLFKKVHLPAWTLTTDLRLLPPPRRLVLHT